MALTNTPILGNIGPSDLFIPVNTSVGFPGVNIYSTRQPIQIDGERMFLDYVITAGAVGSIKVAMRGYDGTVAMAHSSGAILSTSSQPQDFLDVPAGFTVANPPTEDDIVTIGSDLTFTPAGSAPVPGVSMPLPLKNTTYYIQKATAAAITLISATAAQAGIRLTFISQTAVAHVITYAPGFLGTGGASDAATLPAAVGAAAMLEAGPTGLWASFGGTSGPVIATAVAAPDADGDGDPDSTDPDDDNDGTPDGDEAAAKDGGSKAKRSHHAAR